MKFLLLPRNIHMCSIIKHMSLLFLWLLLIFTTSLWCDLYIYKIHMNCNRNDKLYFGNMFAKSLQQDIGVIFLIQFAMKNLKTLGMFFSIMYRDKGVVWKLLERIRTSFSNWAHRHIKMHKPRKEGSQVFGANWCMNKPWTCKGHYNLDLGGVTNLLRIIHFYISSRKLHWNDTFLETFK
jgi:hypothetical protein